MPGILGRKVGMTRVFQDDGCVIPLTLVECQPNTVVQVKTLEKDGYPAIVLGFKQLKRPKKNKKFYHLREFRVEKGAEYKIGDLVTLESFKDAELVKVSGVSKGKGFQGFIKRHNFSSGGASHGSHHNREPGSIGCRAKPGRVHKGKKMAGHMGVDRVTLRDVKVVSVDVSKHLIALKGPLPGANNGVITILA